MTSGITWRRTPGPGAKAARPCTGFVTKFADTPGMGQKFERTVDQGGGLFLTPINGLMFQSPTVGNRASLCFRAISTAVPTMPASFRKTTGTMGMRGA